MSFYSQNGYLTPISRSKVKWRSKSSETYKQGWWLFWLSLVTIPQATAELWPIMLFYSQNGYLTPISRSKVKWRSESSETYKQGWWLFWLSLVTIPQAMAELCPIMSFYSQNAYLTPISRSKVKWRSKSLDMCGLGQWSFWSSLVKIGHGSAELDPNNENLTKL